MKQESIEVIHRAISPSSVKRHLGVFNRKTLGKGLERRKVPVRSTIYIFYMTCGVCICEKGGLGTKKIYIKLAINLHLSVRMSLCADTPERAQLTLSPGSP